MAPELIPFVHFHHPRLIHGETVEPFRRPCVHRRHYFLEHKLRFHNQIGLLLAANLLDKVSSIHQDKVKLHSHFEEVWSYRLACHFVGYRETLPANSRFILHYFGARGLPFHLGASYHFDAPFPDFQ